MAVYKTFYNTMGKRGCNGLRPYKRAADISAALILIISYTELVQSDLFVFSIIIFHYMALER